MFYLLFIHNPGIKVSRSNWDSFFPWGSSHAARGSSVASANTVPHWYSIHLWKNYSDFKYWALVKWSYVMEHSTTEPEYCLHCIEKSFVTFWNWLVLLSRPVCKRHLPLQPASSHQLAPLESTPQTWTEEKWCCMDKHLILKWATQSWSWVLPRIEWKWVL